VLLLIELVVMGACSGVEEGAASAPRDEPDDDRAVDAGVLDDAVVEAERDATPADAMRGHGEAGGRDGEAGVVVNAADDGGEGGVMDAADASVPPNVVFVTSEKRAPGSLGGLAGADAFCNHRAAAAGLEGTYVAWLSTAQESARSRIGAAAGWVRPDGLPFTADLAAGETHVWYPARLDEFGAPVAADEVVVTGTNYDGDFAGSSCGEWTSNSGGVTVGYAAGGTGTWTNGEARSCATPLRVYCFGVERTASVMSASAVGRVAFVSAALIDPSIGVASADALCAGEASDAALPGTFKALMSTNGTPAASRFATGAGTATWVRSDGVPLAASAAAFMAGELVASLNLSAKGGSYENYVVWIGAPADAAAGAPAKDCLAWSSHGEADVSIAGHTARASRHLFDNGATACSFPAARILCLQD
jgi:hypothetical protein